MLLLAHGLALRAAVAKRSGVQRGQITAFVGLWPRPSRMLRADLKVVLCRSGIVGEPRRESMIGIKQLRWTSAQSRVT
jgi:hypothetical protein